MHFFDRIAYGVSEGSFFLFLLFQNHIAVLGRRHILILLEHLGKMGEIRIPQFQRNHAHGDG